MSDYETQWPIGKLVQPAINGVLLPPARITGHCELDGRLWGCTVTGSNTGIELKDLVAIPDSPTVELTLLTKTVGGVLSKSLWLDVDNTLVSDNSACCMWEGKAERVKVTGAAELAALIGGA
jgi:hypothetical protein